MTLILIYIFLWRFALPEVWKYTSTVWQYQAILIPVATPQDNIIETLEAEIVRLKAQLSDTEDRLSKIREKFDDMAIKLYGGGRN